jgi:hypothetical protein
MNCIDIERRRRCWSGVLMLHTYQAISFKDVNVLHIASAETKLPADVNDCDISEDRVSPASTMPTQMSTMRYKINLYQLSARICTAVSSKEGLSETELAVLDAEIAGEQARWDTTFLLEGSPSVLETSSYAQWCLLQLYANQLYLLLHRQFCRIGTGSSTGSIRASRDRCIVAGAAMLDIHRQIFETPRLRHLRWYMDGLTSFCAFHGAVALATCLLSWEGGVLQQEAYRATFDAALSRINQLQTRSRVCKKAYPILLQLQYVPNRPPKTDLCSLLRLTSEIGICYLQASSSGLAWKARVSRLL